MFTQPTLHRHNTTFYKQTPDSQQFKNTPKSQIIKPNKLNSKSKPLNSPIPSQLNSSIHTSKLIFQSTLNQTKKPPNNQKPPIQKIYADLHDYINTVDTKIQYLLQKQSNQYKVVYQHYYNKFKDQLYELKQKTLQQQQTFLKNDHVHYIENQLKISREQASTYQNLYQKAKIQNDSLRASLELHKRDLAMLEANSKQYIKEIKALQKKIHENHPQDIQPNSSTDLKEPHQTPQKTYQITDHSPNDSPQKSSKAHLLNRRSNSLSFQIPQKPQIKISLNQFSPKFQCLKSDSKISPQTNILSAVANEIRSQSIRSVQNSESKQIKNKQEQRLGFAIKVPRKQKEHFQTEIVQKAQNNMKTFNICEWFLQCVESVKKQILKRKSRYFDDAMRISADFRNFHSLEDFLNLDKLEVLKMFISKKQCIQIVYNLIRNQRSTQQNEDLYRISQYQNSSEISKAETKNAKFRQSNFQSREPLTHTIFNVPEKLKFNKTFVQVNSGDQNKMLHKSLNQKQMIDCVSKATNANLKTSMSLTKDRLNCIQEMGESSSLNKNLQRGLGVGEMVERGDWKGVGQMINEKKNIRLSTHLIIRKKKMMTE